MESVGSDEGVTSAATGGRRGRHVHVASGRTGGRRVRGHGVGPTPDQLNRDHGV